MTRRFEFAVLMSFCVPTQLPTDHPLAGLAPSWIASPERYWREGHPELCPGEAVGAPPPRELFAARLSEKQRFTLPTAIWMRLSAAPPPCFTTTFAV